MHCSSSPVNDRACRFLAAGRHHERPGVPGGRLTRVRSCQARAFTMEVVGMSAWKASLNGRLAGPMDEGSPAADAHVR